ncbi:DNA ligase D [Segetibacter sp.]|uniref:DNA ligase D n=1 Tax=Segetibacter sp. TaxID=2231182 RepID=UPI00260AD18E|nr:DNA ligase D [Segetibacter sp.]MCW3082294.1 ligase [Segetibacter sp.]
MKAKKTTVSKTSTTNNTATKGVAAPFPADIKPMLATLVSEPVEEEGWLYEVKWDGFRALAYINEGIVEIRSRNNKSFNEKFYPVYNALQQWGKDIVVDGEIVVLNKKGVPDFGGLQNWRSEADGQLAYYLFDILWLNGKDLMRVPLQERRELLRSVSPQGLIKLSENFEATGNEFFALADKMGLEGIMAKKADSLYVPDARSKDWLKIKTEKHQELIIGGYTKNEGTPKPFSALLLGWFIGNEFHHVTPVGTGFTVKLQKEILEKLEPLKTTTCPFKHVPAYNKASRFRPNPPKADVVWVRPEMVCEISYREMTKDGSIRHPSFRGLREDKNATEVVREIPAPITEIVNDENKLVKKKVLATPVEQERKTLLNPNEETQVKNVGGHDMKFTNLSKIYWPDDNVTKRDMINYYYQVAPYMLPYVKDRPQTLNRFPHGIKGETFYQKDVKGKAPEWIKTFPYHSYTDGRDKEFLVCTDEASLLYIASLGCIEINPWSSRTEKPDNPDWCIIDLDPDKNTFEQVMEAACVTKQILDAIEVTAYPKTSGSTGLHIYIPFGAKYTYEDSKEFGRKLAKLIHAQLPDFTSIERKVVDRQGKMYIDFLQNRPQATVAGPYSLRPKQGATVSMPLHWDEIKLGLTIKSFTIFNAVDRLKEQGDLFTGVLGEGIDLEKALQKLESMFGG